MAQFDIHRNPVGDMADAAPYVVALQADPLAAMPTRLVAPLALLEDFQPVRNLNPIVEIDGERFAVMVNLMATLPRTVLGAPVGSLAQHRNDIIAALDFLFTGI
ncbi:MAG TPA: CcdB family protein [Magnetospirillum sp.]|jgi:toxin CcdB|nr:CcdB family protein [Magnetospirillum sp.]